MNKKIGLAVLMPFIGAIPVIIVSIFEKDIVDQTGYGTWNILFIISMILVVVLSFFPFWKIFKGMFGGPGSYNYFWGRGKAAQEILASGKSATATLVSIGENSEGGVVTINGQPLLNLVLQISFGHGQPYDVSFNTIIPRASISQFYPGVQFPVKVDPLNNNNIVYNQQALKTGKKPTVGGKNWTDTDRMLLEMSGIEAMAKLLRFDDTGRTDDLKSLFTIAYEVYIPGKESYQFSKEIPVPPESINLMRSAVGKIFKAKVHPQDKEKIVVDITP
jgi:hypothetical protein